MGVDAWGFPGGLLRLDPAFAYVEPPSSWTLPRAECLTLAPLSNPLQCSCLETPRDRGAWWAAIYGVAQSRTQLKRLSSSSSSSSSRAMSAVIQHPLQRVIKALMAQEYTFLKTFQQNIWNNEEYFSFIFIKEHINLDNMLADKTIDIYF